MSAPATANGTSDVATPQFIPLAAGLNTDVVEKLVAPGSVLVLENCYSDVSGQVRKRLGADTLSTAAQGTIPSGSTLTPPYQLATRQGSLLRFETQFPVRGWDPGAKKWVSPGSTSSGIRSYHRGPVNATTTPVFSATQAGQQTQNPDARTGNGYAVVAFEQSDVVTGATSVREQVVDLATGQVVFDAEIASVKYPRVVVDPTGAHAVVVYFDGATLFADIFDLTAPGTPVQHTIGSPKSTTCLDVRAGSVVHGPTDVSVLYIDNSDALQCVIITTAGGGVSTFQVQNVAANVAPNVGFAWMQDLGVSGKFAVIQADSTRGLTVLWDLPAPSGSVSVAAATMVLDASVDHRPSSPFSDGLRQLIGTTTSSSSAGVFRVFYDWVAVGGAETVKAATWNGSVTLGNWYRSVGIVSKLWLSGGGLYFWATHLALDQSTYFVLGSDFDPTPAAAFSPAPLATAFVRAAATVPTAFFDASDVSVQADGSIISAVAHETRVESVLGGSATATGTTESVNAIDLLSVTHRSAPEIELGKPVEFMDSVFTPGGVLKCFDGTTYGLAGFAYYPPDSVSISTNPGGNLQASAQYVYRGCYSYVDHNGRKWRSAPSTPVAAGTSDTDKQFNVTFHTLQTLDRGRAPSYDGYQFELYRSQADENDAFFLVASYPNDPSAFTVTIIDNVADADLGEELYTDGGGLENQLLPSVSHVVAFQNRLVTAQAGTGTLWYSLDIDLTHGLLFNEALTLDVGDPADPITGLAALGTMLIVFKKDLVYAVSGQGADALGSGATYDFRIIASGEGCSNAASILSKEGEVWFQSGSTRAGIHKIDAGLHVTYAGQGVKAYDNALITAAVVVASLSQVRFYTGSGTTLTWDWIGGIWSTNTEESCVSAVSTYRGIPGVVYANNTDVLAEATLSSADPWSEAGSDYRPRIRSPWLSLAGVDDWERIKRIQGVGEPNGPHTVNITMYRDFDETDVIAHLTKVFDGTETKWTWEVRPKIQKLSAMLIEIEIGPYVPPPVVFSPPPNAGDEYAGSSIWDWPAAAFTDEMAGGTVVVTGEPTGQLNGAYAIVSVGSANALTLSPAPTLTGGPPVSLVGATVVITFQPPTVNGPGPGISGINVTATAKEGQSKLSPGRRAT